MTNTRWGKASVERRYLNCQDLIPWAPFLFHLCLTISSLTSSYLLVCSLCTFLLWVSGWQLLEVHVVARIRTNMPQWPFWKLADLGTGLGLILTTRAHLGFPSSPSPQRCNDHFALMRLWGPFQPRHFRILHHCRWPQVLEDSSDRFAGMFSSSAL